jgi:thiol-disulfide isomerase/thioredoxin
MDTQVLTLLGTYGDLRDLESLPTLSKRWKDNRRYWERMLMAYGNNNADAQKIHRTGLELIRLAPKDKDQGGEIRYDVAELWLEHGVDPKAAEALAREAVGISEIGGRPVGPALASPEQKRFTELKMIVKLNRSTLGWALYYERRYGEALQELNRAVAEREREGLAARAVYYRLGRTLEKLGRQKEALDAYIKELAWGDYERPTRRALSEVYSQLHGNQQGLDTAVRSGINDLLLKPGSKYPGMVKETDEDLGRFELQQTNGKPIDLMRYRGKVVIIDFWATWCAPCLKLMEETDRLQKSFPGRLVVVAVSLDPEEGWKTAAEYITNKHYDFVLVFDDENKRTVSVPVLPSRLLLDQTGRVRVREYGYLNGYPKFDQRVRELLSQ